MEAGPAPGRAESGGARWVRQIATERTSIRIYFGAVGDLEEAGLVNRLIERLDQAGMHPAESAPALRGAIDQLWKIERMAFVGLIRGEGYKTLWTAQT